MSDIQKANKLGKKLYTIITVILFIAYLIEYIKGAKTLPVFLLIAVLDLGPMLATHLVYAKAPESQYIKHLIGIGYGIFYAANCFISSEQMVFVYAIPMLIATTIFCDFAFSKLVSVVICVVAIAHGIWYTNLQGWSSVAVSALEIEIAATVLICIYSVLSNKFVIEMNQKKMDEVNEAGNKTKALVEGIMNIAGSLTEEISSVSEKMEMLGASSEETLREMQEVTAGSDETAESVKNQLYKTEEIQTQIDRVSDTAKNIGDNVDDTVEACHKGRDNIKKLIDQSKISEEAGNGAMKEVEELEKSTVEMQQIVELIKSVATQTSLLALNASIEAARAGEAGRGFAVVATEISNLAGQTQTATGNISSLIEGLSKEMTDVVNAIRSLVDSNALQNESAEITAESFERIVENIRSIRTNSHELTGAVENLASANQEIVDSIQKISAITDEVSNHSNTTCETSEQNKIIVNEVSSLVNEMTRNSEELMAMK